MNQSDVKIMREAIEDTRRKLDAFDFIFRKFELSNKYIPSGLTTAQKVEMLAEATTKKNDLDTAITTILEIWNA